MVPAGKVDPGRCDLVQTRLPDEVQLSVAVGSVHDTIAVPVPALLETVLFEGQPMITGFCVSFTVTVKLQVDVFEAASTTVRRRLEVPTLNVFVPGCPLPLKVVAPVDVHVSVGAEVEQLSVKTIAGIITLALHRLLSLPTTIGSGQVTAGFSLSVTVTVKLQVIELEAASVTVKVLVVTPTGKVDPLGNPAV